MTTFDLGPVLAVAALVALGVELVVVGACALVLAADADDCGDLDIVPEPSRANLERHVRVAAVDRVLELRRLHREGALHE